MGSKYDINKTYTENFTKDYNETYIKNENISVSQNYYDNQYDNNYDEREGFVEKTKKSHANNYTNDNDLYTTKPLHESNNMTREDINFSKIPKTKFHTSYKDRKELELNDELYNKNNQLGFSRFSMQLLGRTKHVQQAGKFSL